MSLSNDGSAAFAGDGNRGEVKSGESGAIRSKPGGYTQLQPLLPQMTDEVVMHLQVTPAVDQDGL